MRLRGFDFAVSASRLRLRAFGFAALASRLRLRGFGFAASVLRLRLRGVGVAASASRLRSFGFAASVSFWLSMLISFPVLNSVSTVSCYGRRRWHWISISVTALIAIVAAMTVAGFDAR